MQLCAARLGGAVLAVAMVAPIAKYHIGQIMVLPAPYTWLVIQWQCSPSKQDSFMPTKGPQQTKGMKGDWISHTCELVYWTRQTFIHFSNLTKPCHGFALSFPQT